jgi:hypothetical protein
LGRQTVCTAGSPSTTAAGLGADRVR